MKALTNKAILSALENSHDGFMISDPRGTILYFNRAYARLTKFFELAKVGKRMQEYIDAGRMKGATCIEAVRQRRTITELHVDDPTGVAIISSARPCFREDGEILYVVTNVRDITEFMDLRKQIDEVQQIVASFAKQIERTERYGENIVVMDQQMRTLLDTAKKIAGVDVSVMIRGESGTGKEVLAKFIHENSPRRRAPFLAVNCGAIPENLLETELFGYAEGTFTGQVKGGKSGLLHAAEHGTLLLDEIGDMPLLLQVKLLRVLETKTYSPVGSTKVVPCDVRILSATNKDLKQMIHDKLFREDLYYRLNVVELDIPALRDRRDDIIPLALYFLEKANLKYHCRKQISSVVMQRLRNHTWPGNVRELRNMIERMTVLSPGRYLELPTDLQDTGAGPDIRILTSESTEVLPLNEYMEKKEKEYLEIIRARCGTTRKMAECLGVDHSTVIRKLKKYGINATK